MEKFRPENIQPKEIVKKDVIDSLVKNPEDFSIYIAWKDARRSSIRMDNNSSWIAQGIELEGARILEKAARESGSIKLFDIALRDIYECAEQADFSRDRVLAKRLYDYYSELLKEYDKRFPAEK